MSNAAPSLEIVDFHTHYLGPSFAPTTLAGRPPAQRGFWEAVNRRLADPVALLSSMEESGIAARVVSMPLEFVQEPGRSVPPATIPRINDAVADLVSRHPGRLYGLATVDAYAGDAAARELERALTELGLRGVFVESAKGDLLPDADAARPTFAVAAALGAPVFLHPVADPPLQDRFKRYGRLGGRLARGTINAAALVALIESGLFEDLPGLRVVVTALALGGVLLAVTAGDGARTFERIYTDTTGLHPATLLSAVAALGADHVLMGTDWPVVVESAVPERLEAALTACGLDAAQRQMIAGGNARRLLGLA